MRKNIILAVEFLILFFGVPLALYFETFITHPSVVLLPLLVMLILYFRTQKDFRLNELVRLDVSNRMLLKQIPVILAISVALVIFVLIFERQNLFNLPRKNITIWVALMIFYPLFSAYAQEVIYRKFLFMRYKPLFKNKWLLILASGITFSFVHIVYFSHLSILLTLLAGLYLAFVYDKTRSVLFTAILHGIFGNLIFTIGLGQHFWLDMAKWL